MVDLNSGLSDVSWAKVRVVSVQTTCIVVDQLTGSDLRYWSTGNWHSPKELPVQKKKWKWGLPLCGPGLQGWNWSWAHKTVLSWGSTFIEFELNFIMLQYHSLVLLCMMYSNQQLESGCSIVYKGPVIMGAEDRRQCSGETLDYRQQPMERWKVSFLDG